MHCCVLRVVCLTCYVICVVICVNNIHGGLFMEHLGMKT